MIELVSLTFFESHFDPNAVKDDDGGDSLGLAQVNVSNLRALGMTREELLTTDGNLRAALAMMRDSHRTCRARPWKQQLAAYATGRGLCGVPEGVRASEHRLSLAKELLREHPPVWTSTAIDRWVKRVE